MKKASIPIPDIDRALPPEQGARAVADLRQDLRHGLPALLRRAIDTYRRFSAGPAPEDAKSFVAYQAGCRAAILHIQLLLKLAACAESEGAVAAAGAAEADAELETLIETAKAALDEHDDWEA
jgi:hypothetical protein